jgi:farnesyl-diphosphate farnesyltransferase
MPHDASLEFDRKYLLGSLLKSVSRSFYLTMQVLHVAVRTPVSVAYLLARAADTIADTRVLPPQERLGLLLAFRAQVNGRVELDEMRRITANVTTRQSDPAERVLLQALLPAVGLLRILDEPDRADVREVVATLTTGMEFDLKTFPRETSGELAALKTLDDLEYYTYLVAGCVGPFWTRVSMRHTPAMLVWNEEEAYPHSIRFGKALQYTNVLRDCARDVRMGRCYLPEEILAAHGLEPRDLLAPENGLRARPVLYDLLRVALGHYEAARHYVLDVPRRCTRIRLACLWPVLIGLATLEKLAANKGWLNPKRPTMVSRLFVERTLLLSWPAAWSDRLLNAWIERRMDGVRRVMAAGSKNHGPAPAAAAR